MDFFGVSKKLALGLLAFLPKTTNSQSNPNSWVSLQGRINGKDVGTAITFADDGSIISSGYHDRGYPNYDGEITVSNPEGQLTSNIQVAAGTSIFLQGNAWYNETVFSAGHVIKEGTTNGFLCGTTLNGTLLNSFELSGLPGATQFSGILASSDNTLVLAGKDAVVMSIYPNGTSKFRYQYPISDAVSLTAIVETDDKDYVTSGFISRSPSESFVAKIDNNGGLIWARELQSSINIKCQINSIHKKNDILFAVGNLDNNGVILQLNATTGSTLNVTTLEGSSTTSFFSGSFVDNQFVAAGFSLTSSPGSRGSIVFNGQDVKMLAGTQLDFFKAAATDTNGQFVSTGSTRSYNGDFNNDKFMTVKFGPDFTLDNSDIPSGLSFYSVTNDFTINYNAGIINNVITGSITPIDLTLTTNFTDITDEITVTHPLTTEFLSTNSPSSQPSGEPIGEPSGNPSGQPSSVPSTYPTGEPSGQPSVEPSSWPTSWPSAWPTSWPSAMPSGYPSAEPSSDPSAYPTFDPTAYPTFNPSGEPSGDPSGQPSSWPSAWPTSWPSTMPSGYPSAEPSSDPSGEPSGEPSGQPSSWPSAWPSSWPSGMPSGYPTCDPSSDPTGQPSADPSAYPTGEPSGQPSTEPSSWPTSWPNAWPTSWPSTMPSAWPTSWPSGMPSGYPTCDPSSDPSGQPSADPFAYPTGEPSGQPSTEPSSWPTSWPSTMPSAWPTSWPSGMPSGYPTCDPSSDPSSDPSGQPSADPSAYPTGEPSGQPSTEPSSWPTSWPNAWPTSWPSGMPSGYPTSDPSGQPSSVPSTYPTGEPSGQPSTEPSSWPTSWPSAWPTSWPSTMPSGYPSAEPSSDPSAYPTFDPTAYPTFNPSGEPSGDPSGQPSSWPSAWPTSWPSAMPSGYPSAEPSADPTSRPTVVGETHAPTVGIIPNWGNVWGVMGHGLSPIDVTQTADYVLGLVNLYSQDNSALMLFDKLDGVLSPYYLSWETTAAVAEGNNLYIAGKTENREPTLVKIDLEHHALSWGKRLSSSLYKIVDINIQDNGRLVTTIENRYNYQSTGSILIEEHDANSGLSLSNQAYVSDLFARPIKGMAFVGDHTYITGQYAVQSQYLTCILNTVTADFYRLSAGYPIANYLDRPLAITSGSNSLYLLTSSIRSVNFYYNLVRLNQVESTLSMAENWPMRTDVILNDIALMHVDNLEYLATCGQANARFFMLKLDAQGNKIAELNIFYGQKELTCASLTYTRHGVIATIRHYEGAHQVISTLFVDQSTFMPAQLPVGFEWAFNDAVTLSRSDLNLGIASTQKITQTPLAYELFSGNITSATDFIQFGLPVPSTPPTWKPSFRPSTPPSPAPSPNPSSSRPSFKPSSYRPTLLGDTNAPTQTDNPTGCPTSRPTYLRGAPSGQPTGQPAPAPTWKPSIAEKSLTPTRRLSPAPNTVSPSIKLSPMPTLAKPKEDIDQSYAINWNAVYMSIAGIVVVGCAAYKLGCFNRHRNKVSPSPTPQDLTLIDLTDMVMYEILNQELADAVSNLPLEDDAIILEEKSDQTEMVEIRRAARELIDSAIILHTFACSSSDKEEQEHVLESIEEGNLVSIFEELDPNNQQSEYRSASPVANLSNPNQDASDSDDSFNRFFRAEINAFNQQIPELSDSEEDSSNNSYGW